MNIRNLTNAELVSLLDQIKAEINFRNQFLEPQDKIKIEPSYNLALGNNKY